MFLDILAIDWPSVLVPDVSPIEIFIRGTVVYLFIFGLLRAFKRESSDVGVADLLVIVMVADAAQNAMAGNFTSLPDGLILVGTIFFWAYALDYVAYRFVIFERWVYPPPLPLVRDGQLLRRNMKKELITENELRSQLREAGIEDLADVAKAFLEADGRMSIVRRDRGETASRERRVS